MSQRWQNNSTHCWKNLPSSDKTNPNKQLPRGQWYRGCFSISDSLRGRLSGGISDNSLSSYPVLDVRCEAKSFCRCQWRWDKEASKVCIIRQQFSFQTTYSSISGDFWRHGSTLSQRTWTQNYQQYWRSKRHTVLTTQLAIVILVRNYVCVFETCRNVG